MAASLVHRRHLAVVQLLVLSGVLSCAHALDGVLHVNHAATGAESGLSWDDAYTCLQDALNHARIANADGRPATDIAEIWIAAGTYKPDQGTGDRTRTFALVDAVALLGGFAGGETSAKDRDWIENPTILSGDLNGDDGPNFTNREDNSYHVITAGNPHVDPPIPPVTSATLLDGIIISGGHANGGAVAPHFDDGGGLFTENGSPSIRNVVFTDNFAGDHGGALFVRTATLDLENVTFTGNKASYYGGSIAALGSFGGSQIVLKNCTFTDNTSGFVAGGVYLENMGTHATITDCLFEENNAASGAALIATTAAAFTVVDSAFRKNSATGVAGAVRTNEHLESSIVRCVFEGNVAGGGGGAIRVSGQFLNLQKLNIRDCLFIDNVAAANGLGAGAAVYAVNWKGEFINNLVVNNSGVVSSGLTIINTSIGGQQFAPVIVNSTFAGNATTTDAGSPVPVISVQRAQPVIRNSIIWHDGTSPIVTTDGGLVTLQFSNVAPGPYDSVGSDNINVEPQFSDPDAGDFRLVAGCASIDAGSNALVPPGITEDFNGDPRIQDGDGNGIAIVNIGATETIVAPPKSPCPADLTGTGSVGVPDLLELLSGWGSNSGQADLSGDGNVGVPDLLILLAAWGPCPR